jgi:organic hydroperoxide reductase OsmC/OhrA
MSPSLPTILYTAKTRTTGGRIGRGTSSDAAIDLPLSVPGSGKPGTNPEQLFGVDLPLLAHDARPCRSRARNCMRLP